MAFKEYVNSLPNLREEKIKEIAEATCSHVTTVYRWMNGSIKPPLLKQKVISLVTGVPLNELFPVDEVDDETRMIMIFFKTMEAAIHDYSIRHGRDYDIESSEKLIIRTSSINREELYFNPAIKVLYLKKSTIDEICRKNNLYDMSLSSMERHLRSTPSFLGYIQAHRFEYDCKRMHTSCIAFNLDCIQQNYGISFALRIEDLKSITHDSDSKKTCLK